MKTLFLGALLLLACSGGGGGGQCDPSNCGGCCNVDICETGVEATACGTGGERCTACATCTQGVCGAGGGSGAAGSGGGVSSGGGSAGGSSAGGGSPTNCATGAPCGTGSYCDLGSGFCKPGCIDNAGCAADRACDLATHACACKPGTHACGSACFSDTDAMHCGSSCTACGGPPANGVTGCIAGACTFDCQPGFNKCGNRCASQSDATACGASCQVCPGSVVGGGPGCNLGACGIVCNTGQIYEPSTGTCRPVTAAVVWSTPFSGAISPYKGRNEQYWVVPRATGFQELLIGPADVGDAALDTEDGQLNATAFGAMPSQISGTIASDYQYLAIVGGTVRHIHYVSSPSSAYVGCSWVHPQVQNPIKVSMGTDWTGSKAWAAVQTAQGITFGEMPPMTGTCSPSTTQIAMPGAIPWTITDGALYYSVANTLTRYETSQPPQQWTLPGPVGELAEPLVRVGSKVYLLQSGSAAPKQIADNVVAMGPSPYAHGYLDASIPVCMRYVDGLRCSYLNQATTTLHPPSLVTADSADFHTTTIDAFDKRASLFYRVGSQIKAVRLK